MVLVQSYLITNFQNCKSVYYFFISKLQHQSSTETEIKLDPFFLLISQSKKCDSPGQNYHEISFVITL